MDRNSPTNELEDAIERFWSVNPYPSSEDFSKQFIRSYIRRCRTNFGGIPCSPISVAIFGVAEHFYDAEGRAQITFARAHFDDPIQRGRYRDALLKFIKLAEQDPETWVRAFIDRFLLIYDPLLRALPTFVFGKDFDTEYPSDSEAPVLDLIKNVGEVVDAMIVNVFIEYPYECAAFDAIKAYLVELGEKVARGGAPIMADEYRSPPREIVNRFLGEGTPLAHLFDVSVPVPAEEVKEEAVPEPPYIPLSTRFQGQWVIGMQGTGKTQLFQFMLSRDLDMVAQGAASIVVLDPTGDQEGRLIHNLISLKRFAPGGDLHGKLVYIDPKDRGYTLPINLLSLRANFDDEEAISSAISSYLSIMGGLMGQPLTNFQEPVFRYAVQAALAFPNPTLSTLRDILQPHSKAYEQVLPKMHPDVRAYFQQVYDTEGPRRSRTEILNRLFTLSSDPKFRRLFNATETRIDFFDEINQPKVIVINASRDYLQSLTELYGRYFLALITGAGEHRASMPMGTPLPCFIYIDECDEFVANDPNAAKILLKLRGMRMALILGNQLVSRITDTSVQESFLGTAIKFVNANSGSARTLAEEMNCVTEAGRIDTSFLVARPALNFAFHIRGQMPKPIAVQVPYGVLESQPHITSAEFAQVRDEIRERYYVSTDAGPVSQVAAATPEHEDEPARLLAQAYQSLADLTQRGEWQKVRELKPSIALLEEQVAALQQAPAVAPPLAPKDAEPKRQVVDAPPEAKPSITTEASSDWR